MPIRLEIGSWAANDAEFDTPKTEMRFEFWE